MADESVFDSVNFIVEAFTCLFELIAEGFAYTARNETFLKEENARTERRKLDRLGVNRLDTAKLDDVDFDSFFFEPFLGSARVGEKSAVGNESYSRVLVAVKVRLWCSGLC